MMWCWCVPGPAMPVLVVALAVKPEWRSER
jgi:hypothetical protein